MNAKPRNVLGNHVMWSFWSIVDTALCVIGGFAFGALVIAFVVVLSKTWHG